MQGEGPCGADTEPQVQAFGVGGGRSVRRWCCSGGERAAVGLGWVGGWGAGCMASPWSRSNRAPPPKGPPPTAQPARPPTKPRTPPPPGMGASSSGGWGGTRVCVCVWCVPWVAAPCLLGPLPGPPPHHTTPTDQPKLEEGSALATTAHTLRGWSPAFAHTPPHPTPPHRPQTYS